MDHITTPLPARIRTQSGQDTISPPPEASLASLTGDFSPKPTYLSSDLGRQAVYDFPPPSRCDASQSRNVLLIHGLNTPALGLKSLVEALQSENANIHAVVFDLWGHGFSDTPLVPHSPHIFQFQILQVLSYMQWPRAHLVGFSYGGSAAVKFATQFPWAVSSVAILAPGGLLRVRDFEPEMQPLLVSPPPRGEDGAADMARQRDLRAVEKVQVWLEGGPLFAPIDEASFVNADELMAAKLRNWELEEHEGYDFSVLSMVREGGCFDCPDWFTDFTKTNIKRLGLVAELDPVCTKAQLEEVGFEQVIEVKGVGHGFVRVVPGVIAKHLQDFWSN